MDFFFQKHIMGSFNGHGTKQIVPLFSEVTMRILSETCQNNFLSISPPELIPIWHQQYRLECLINP